MFKMYMDFESLLFLNNIKKYLFQDDVPEL
jgi:hypothetical protein